MDRANGIKSIRAFTIIELLVVITIIGLLASVVVSSLNSARKSAITMTAVEFASNNYHVTGINDIFDMNFNEADGGSGSLPKDSMGNWSTAQTVYHSPLTPFTDKGSSMDTVHASPGYPKMVPRSPISVANGMTASIWFNTTMTSGTKYIYNIDKTDGAHSLEVELDTSPVQIKSIILEDKYPVFSVPYNDGLWHNVTISLAIAGAQTNYSVYYDGQLKSSGSTANIPSTLNTWVSVGWDGWSTYYTGYIDNFQIFSQALTSMDVRNIYAQGLIVHELATADLR